MKRKTCGAGCKPAPALNRCKKIISKLSNAGLLLLVFLLPLQTRWIVGQGMIGGNPNEFLTMSLYGVDIFVILLLVVKVLFLGNLKIFKSTLTLLFQRRMLMLVGIFIFWNIISIFWAANKILAVQHAVWLVLAAGLARLIVSYKNKYILMNTVLVGLTISAWLGVWQFVTQSTFACKWLGLASHDPRLGGTSIVEMYTASGAPIRWLRAYSFFDHPNIFGMAMVVGILILIVELTQNFSKKNTEKKCHPELVSGSCNFVHRALNFWIPDPATGRARQVWNNKKIKLEFAIQYFALTSMSTGLFASLSRSAWLGLILGIIIIVVMLRSRLRDMFKPLAVIAITFAILAAIYPAQFLMRSGGTGRLEKKSLDDRAVYLQQGKQIIRDNSLFGVGAGNYIETVKENKPGNPAWTYQPVHNVFLLVWAELGIIGMLILLVLLFATLQRAWQCCNVLGLALLASLAPTLLLDHWLWSLHFGSLLVGVIVVILLQKNEKKGY